MHTLYPNSKNNNTRQQLLRQQQQQQQQHTCTQQLRLYHEAYVCVVSRGEERGKRTNCCCCSLLPPPFDRDRNVISKRHGENRQAVCVLLRREKDGQSYSKGGIARERGEKNQDIQWRDPVGKFVPFDNRRQQHFSPAHLYRANINSAIPPSLSGRLLCVVGLNVFLSAGGSPPPSPETAQADS